MTIGKYLNERSIYILPMAVLMFLAVVLRLLDPAPIAALRLNVFDQYLRMAPREADPEFPVRIVAIDEPSLERLGQWPWPRSVLAQIVSKLNTAGAKAIIFDIILPEPDRMSPKAFAQAFEGEDNFETIKRLAAGLPSNDERLSQALSNGPGVLGFSASDDTPLLPPEPKAGIVAMGDAPKDFVPSFKGGIASVPVLNSAAKGLGAVNWIPDQDQVLRRVPLLIRVGDHVYPSLALEALRAGEGLSTILYRGSGGSGARAFGQRSGIETVKVGTHLFPTNKKGELWLRFAKSDARRYISAYQVLEPSFDPSSVRGRYVLLGASATGLLDLRATPLTNTIPGVEVHAQALEQMLSGKHTIRPAYALGMELLFLVGVGIGLAWLIGATGPLVAAVIGFLAICFVVAVSWFSYVKAGVLLDAVYPSLALVGVYMAGSLTSFIRSERERTRVRAAFSNYVAPQLVEELAKDPTKLKLGGETREVTVLFSDVRSFSGISERLEAEELIAFINRLFTPLADIILEERGTIDKFMGDAVMAFWNAPVHDKEHAQQACRAALSMMSRMETLNRKWKRVIEGRGETYEPVRIGIGINTGFCCVGNVGSPQRFDYSILGDVVNVASRLESVTKTYGCGIIVGERLKNMAQGFAFLELDTITLKGKSAPQSIYALLGDENVSSSQDFQALKIAHDELIVALQSNAWAKAKSALGRCEDIDMAAYGPIRDYFRNVMKKL